MREQPITRRTFLATSAAGAAAWVASRQGRAETKPPGFRLVDQPGGRLRILEADQPVVTYNWRDQLKEGVPEDRKRSCYCHPVWAPDGTILTDDFPKDHYHHRGIFWTWPHMKTRGKTVQTWHLQGIHQRFKSWNHKTAGAQRASIDVANDWLLDDGERVGRERLLMVVHRASALGRAIDLTLTFEAVGGPMELLGAKGKGYGGLCLRFAPRAGTVITTDAGVRKGDSNKETPKWADLSARFAGKTEMAGAAVFLHPGSHWKPTGWTLRHYGFLGPSWPGLKPYTLEPGAPVTLRYRVYVHRGGAAEGKVAEAYAQYAASAAIKNEA